ncbi:Clp protease N-terminal domain-containing protein [Spirillospora sp. NPDC048911]|uniref:Clp protease N-terminal domain-containing protein n=1 Tax=Spirillospora sp. NPDC048911 TaxID=3364527 RepID=UPI003719BE05
MFERFTQEARNAVTGAQQEARELGHGRIGPEHVLLALLANDGPAAAAMRAQGLELTAMRATVARLAAETSGDPLDPEALRTLGIDLDAVREATEQTFGEGALDAPPGRFRGSGKRHLPFSPPAKKSLELSLRQALRLKHNHIGAGHVLLGILQDRDSRAVRVLVESGADLDALRTEVTRLITAEAA